MRCKVYKYPVQLGVNAVQMPQGAKILTAGAQANESGYQLVIWALVPETSALEVKSIVVVYTGQPFDCAETANYIGSVVTPNGLVHHVFEGAQ